MSEVIRHNKLDISSLHYSKPINQNNLYYGSIDYNNNPCYIQTAKLVVEDIKEVNKQKYIVLKVDPDDFSFYDLLVKLDDHNLSSTYKFSKEWFNKELPMDILEKMYRRITLPFKKDDVPTIDLKIPVIKNNIQSKIYDQSNNVIEFDKITKGSTIICIIHIKGLKFLKKDYYCDNYITQIKLCESITYSIPNKCLIEFDEEDNTYDNKYDYEILDEEIIQKNKEKLDLEEQFSELEKKIIEDTKILSELKQKIDNLK